MDTITPKKYPPTEPAVNFDTQSYSMQETRLGNPQETIRRSRPAASLSPDRVSHIQRDPEASSGLWITYTDSHPLEDIEEYFVPGENPVSSSHANISQDGVEYNIPHAAEESYMGLLGNHAQYGVGSSMRRRATKEQPSSITSTAYAVTEIYCTTCRSLIDNLPQTLPAKATPPLYSSLDRDYQNMMAEVDTSLKFAQEMLKRFSENSPLCSLLQMYIDNPKLMIAHLLGNRRSLSNTHLHNTHETSTDDASIKIAPCGHVYHYECLNDKEDCCKSETCKKTAALFSHTLLVVSLNPGLTPREQAELKGAFEQLKFNHAKVLTELTDIKHRYKDQFPQNAGRVVWGNGSLTNRSDWKTFWKRRTVTVLAIGAGISALIALELSKATNPQEEPSFATASNCMYPPGVESAYQNVTLGLNAVSYVNQSVQNNLPSLNRTACDTMLTVVEKVSGYLDKGGISQVCKQAILPLLNPLGVLALTAQNIGSLWNYLSGAEANVDCALTPMSSTPITPSMPPSTLASLAPPTTLSTVLPTSATQPSTSVSLAPPANLDEGALFLGPTLVESKPIGIIAGDFNEDGKVDFAVTNQISNTVSVLLGKGDGSFQTAVNYGGSSAPEEITTGDFNRDGKLDLAVTSLGSNTVSLLLGQGDGTFQAAANYGVGSNPHGITTGDFNRDGKLDLAVTNYGSNNLSVLFGNGDGTFQAAVNYGVGSGPVRIAAGDFNRDGKLDLAATNRFGSSVSLLLGASNGTFQTAINYGVGPYPWEVTTGDFNRDGKVDLAVANTNSNTVSILLGNEDGTFQTAVNYGAGTQSAGITTGDVNGDGRADLVVANYGANTVSLLLGNRNGTFQPAINYPVSSGPQEIAAIDLNRDGKTDLAVTNTGAGSVSVLLNLRPSSALQLGFAPAVNYGVGLSPRYIATYDFNGDGKIDLAVTNSDSNTVSILLAKGDGTFQLAVNYGVAASNPNGIKTADFNGDGKADLAATNSNSNSISVLLGNGDGSFQTAVNYGFGSTPAGITIGDFNGDGKTDLAATNYLSNAVSLLLGVGDGSFQAAVNYGVGAGPQGITTSDFNRDGKADLALSNEDSNSISLLIGNGDGTFQAAVNYAVGAMPVVITTTDFNGDGKADLAVGNYGSGTVSLLIGKGDGTFQTAVNYGAGPQPAGITTGDFNGDGKADLALTNYYGSNTVSLLIGRGDGTFQSAVNYAVGSVPTGIVTADFNGDGTPDLAVGNSGSNTVSILLNTD